MSSFEKPTLPSDSWSSQSAHCSGTSLHSTASLRSAAIHYRPGSGQAPSLSAVAQGEQAKEMQRIARRYGVPIRNNQKLAQGLSTNALSAKGFSERPVDGKIPETYYDDVARMLVELGILE